MIDETNCLVACTFVRTRSQVRNIRLCVALENTQTHLPGFVTERREIANENEKLLFFDGLCEVAHSEDNRIEMLQLSDVAKMKLCSDLITSADAVTKRNLAEFAPTFHTI